MINFGELKNLYKTQIDMILAQTGLTISCQLDYGVSKKDLCPNCLFDSNTNKSANKYKPGGPILFDIGRTCPYCNGIGFYGENNRQEEVYLAVIWDSKSWINFPTNIQSNAGFIQTICKSDLFGKLESANNLIINGDAYQLEAKPIYAGLGDDRYIISTWKKVNAI
jgi:hypothetical protein